VPRSAAVTAVQLVGVDPDAKLSFKDEIGGYEIRDLTVTVPARRG